MPRRPPSRRKVLHEKFAPWRNGKRGHQLHRPVSGRQSAWRYGNRPPCWAHHPGERAGSTSRGCNDAAHRMLQQAAPGMRMVLVLPHARRRPDVDRLARRRGDRDPAAARARAWRREAVIVQPCTCGRGLLDGHDVSCEGWQRLQLKKLVASGQLGRWLGDVAAARFPAKPRGGRRTYPAWTIRRGVALKKRTWKVLERLARIATKRAGFEVSCMQVAALLLERQLDDAGEKA